MIKLVDSWNVSKRITPVNQGLDSSTGFSLRYTPPPMAEKALELGQSRHAPFLCEALSWASTALLTPREAATEGVLLETWIKKS